MNARPLSILSVFVLCSIVSVLEACRQVELPELPDVKIHLMDANDDDWEKELDRRLSGMSKEEQEQWLLAHTFEKSNFVRFRVYRRLVGCSSVALWLKALDDSNVSIQFIGISELGRLKAKEAIVPLINLFNDSRGYNARVAIINIGDRAISELWFSLINRLSANNEDQMYKRLCVDSLEGITGKDIKGDIEWLVEWADAHRDKLDPKSIRLLDEMLNERRMIEAARVAKIKALTVSAVPEKTRWRVGEKVKIAVKLTNNGKEPLRIAPTSGELGVPYLGPCHAYIRVFDTEGRRAEYDPTSMVLPPWEINGDPGAPMLDEEDLVLLEPTKSWEATFDHSVMWKPGKYKVFILYVYNRDYPDGVWRGETESAPFDVEITKE